MMFKAFILTDKIQDKNTFDHPDNVKPVEFKDYKVTEKGIDFTILPCSVMHFVID
jgi:alpha-L-arabinofuranosidase